MPGLDEPDIDTDLSDEGTEENSPGRVLAVSVGGQGELAPLFIRSITNFSGTLTLSYNASVLNVYANSDRTGPIASGGSVSPGTTLYAEGIAAGSTLVTLNYNHGTTTTDSVRLTVVNVDLDIDSNNDGTVNGADDPIETDAPGKIILWNNDDDDGNGVADYADPGPAPAPDNELISFQLNVDHAGLSQPLIDDLRATLEFDTALNSVRVWDTPFKRAQIALPATWAPADLPAVLFAEGIAPGDVVFKLTLKRQSTGQIFGTDSIRVTVNYINLIGYRPQTTPFITQPVPFGEEDNPGIHIRRNGDDDDGNGTPDLMDTSVANEDDLIRVDIETSLAGTGVRYVLQKTLGIRIWTSPTKGTELLPMQTSGTLMFPNGAPATAWVEWVLAGTDDAQATLTLRMQDSVSGNEVDIDRLVLHPFRSIVIVFGGDGQDPTGSPPPDNLGIFKTAIDLYGAGYDVHMYNEESQSPEGNGAAYDEVVSAISYRGVTTVAIFGFSQGGGATFQLANALAANAITVGTFQVAFTAYVDAIRVNVIAPEDRRPPGTAWHLNIFETNTPIVHGASMPGGPPNGADEDIDADAAFRPGIGHTDMDDDLQVRARVRARFEQRLANR